MSLSRYKSLSTVFKKIKLNKLFCSFNDLILFNSLIALSAKIFKIINYIDQY